MLIVVTGCYSELNRGDVQSMIGVEAIVSNTNKIIIINKLSTKTIGGTLCFPTETRSRFFLKIQDVPDRYSFGQLRPWFKT